MIFDVKSANVGVLLVLIYGVSSNPRPSDIYAEDNMKKDILSEKSKVSNDMQQKEGALTGSIEIDDENIKGHIELPSGYENLNENNPNDKQNSDIQQNEDAITGSIDIDDENIKGHIELPSGYENLNENNPNDKQNSDIQQNEDAITGSIDIDDENIKGHIELPSDYDNPNENIPNDKHNSDIKQNEDAITRSIDIDDENIKGHIDLPSDYENPNENDPNDKQSSDMLQKEDVITGSIDMDDENIKGHVELPSEEYNPHQAISQNEDDQDPTYVEILEEEEKVSEDEFREDRPSKDLPTSGKSCWMSLNAKHHLDALDKIDAKYAKARRNYQAQVGKAFDKKMMAVMLESQGAAPRAVHQAQGDPSRIPAGINLGGFCMMRMPGSILFFHRMKLRNSTRFSVNYLGTDLENMTLTARLSLNDLHLMGAYERATTDRNPGSLYYVPNFGEVEMLLKKVFYKMEGRLRMLNNRLIVELVNSDLLTNDILMKYANDSASLKLKTRNIEDFLERLKTDLDLWLKDYFNDYLMYFGIVGGSNSEIQTYEKKKTIELNAYADYAIKGIKGRLRSLGASSVKIPNFTITSVLNNQIKLTNGVLRGLDSMYRRSVATTKKKLNIRQLDIIIGFSNLKLEFKYEAQVGMGMHPLSGKLLLTADELNAHMELVQIAEPETLDLSFDSIVQTKPDSLTIEGPASRMIANFKQLLEHPIIAIMTNTLKHNIKMMKTLTRCVPYIYGAGKQILPSEATNKDANGVHHDHPANDDHYNNNIDETVPDHDDDELPNDGNQYNYGNSDISPEENEKKR